MRLLNSKYHNLDSKMQWSFCQDKVLNISSNYMKPGFATVDLVFKEIKALNAFAIDANIKTPLLSAIPESNETMINSLEQIISIKNQIESALLV